MANKTPAISNCPKCGLDWLGTSKCECGWRPDNKKSVIQIAVVCLLIGLAGGICYLMPRYYEIFPNDKGAEEHLSKAQDELRRENAQNAFQEFRQAIAFSPKRADIHRQLAHALYEEERVSEARLEMELAHKYDPRDEDIAAEYAKALHADNHSAEAAKVYSEAFGENPSEFEEKRKLASYCMEANELPRAEKLLTEMTKLNPTLGNGAWIALAEVQAKQKQTDKMLNTLRNGVSYLPGDSFLRELLATQLVEHGKNDEAINELTRATELDPSYAQRNSELVSKIKKGEGKLKIYSIPLRREGNSFIAKVRINDLVDGNFVVDTGASVVAISRGLAKKLNMTALSGTPTVLAGATGVALSQRIVLKSVQTGDAREELINATILPAETGIDGLLGMTFLSRYQFSIDFKNNVLVLKHQ